jgi:hypothetical protein
MKFPDHGDRHKKLRRRGSQQSKNRTLLQALDNDTEDLKLELDDSFEIRSKKKDNVIMFREQAIHFSKFRG